jgi:hypothetical protein
MLWLLGQPRRSGGELHVQEFAEIEATLDWLLGDPD